MTWQIKKKRVENAQCLTVSHAPGFEVCEILNLHLQMARFLPYCVILQNTCRNQLVSVEKFIIKKQILDF
jgi:hypothetical protein